MDSSVGRRPAGESLDQTTPYQGVSPFEAASGAEAVDRYDCCAGCRKGIAGSPSRADVGLMYPEVFLPRGRALVKRTVALRVLLPFSDRTE
jgi:hypothetical protein